MRSLVRYGLVVLVLGFAGGIVFWSVQGSAGEVTVYKSPTCGCCKEWVKHLEANGFKVQARDVADVTPLKAKHGVSPELGSCHTALVDGYVIEGHVPAADVRRLLKERPAVKGLAVPGMPVGSPGMEGPYKEPYSVLTFDEAGRTTVYARH
jgi:hypothetical protein